MLNRTKLLCVTYLMSRIIEKLDYRHMQFEILDFFKCNNWAVTELLVIIFILKILSKKKRKKKEKEKKRSHIEDVAKELYHVWRRNLNSILHLKPTLSRRPLFFFFFLIYD